MIYFKRKSLWKRLFVKLSKIKILPLKGIFVLLKFVFLSCFSLVILIYCTYLFLLPKIVTDDKVENLLNNFLKAHTKLTLDISNLKISPDYKFDIKLNADKISLNFLNGKNFITLEKPDIEIELITLFFNYIDLSKIKTKSITLNTNFTKDKRYDCFDYFDLNNFNFNNSKFTLRSIKFITDEINFNLYDDNTKKNYKIHTNKLTFSSNGENKPVSVKTDGNIAASDKIADFKLNLVLTSQELLFDKFKTQIQNLNYNPFIYAEKFKFYTNSDINLKINNNSINGYVNLSDFRFMIDNIQIPSNSFSLVFNDNKIKANADFNLIKNQFFKFNLNADYSKNKFIELKLNSNEINLLDLKKILSAVCKIFNINYNLDLLNVEGSLSADIYLKSNFSSIISSGFINLQNATIKDSITGLVLNKINSHINFNNNKIDIQNATAYVDNSKFHLEGNIDNQTNLNLKVNSDPVNVAQIMNTAKRLPLLSHLLPKLDEYIFKSGFFRINAIINGTVANPVIKTNSYITDLKLYVKSLNSLIYSKELIISANPEGSAIKNIFITAKNNVIDCDQNKITNNISKLRISNQDIIIEKTKIKYDKILADVEGIIKNYNSNSTLELLINGTLPLNNDLIVIKNKMPHLVANVLIDKNKLTVKDAKIFEGSKNYILASGNIINYSNKNPNFDNFKVSIVNRITCILPKADNLAFDASGDVAIFGSLQKPLISGALKLYNVACKKYELFIQDCNLTLKNSHVEGNIVTLNMLDTTLCNVIFRGLVDGDILKIQHFAADIFQGSISGNTDINIKNFKVRADLVLKEISVRHISGYLKQYSIAASGKLSAMARINFVGFDYDAILNSLSGYIKFNIDDGELSQFAKLERFLQAGNVLSQGILKLSLNSILTSVSKHNTGHFKTIEGTIKLSSPYAQIQYINTVGSNMSLHIEGKYHIIQNYAMLRVLGRIPMSVVNVLGGIGKFSLSQLIEKDGNMSLIEKMMSEYITDADKNNIPTLANYNPKIETREFVVIIDGPLNSNSSVKHFRWAYKN